MAPGRVWLPQAQEQPPRQMLQVQVQVQEQEQEKQQGRAPL